MLPSPIQQQLVAVPSSVCFGFGVITIDLSCVPPPPHVLLKWFIETNNKWLQQGCAATWDHCLISFAQMSLEHVLLKQVHPDIVDPLVY